ncbi:MAG: TcpQ domain-containing protein [Rhodospirillales bacterium]|nr:TcpQ domain-containing protein [Rhodospirillales bacterium]
MACSLGAVISTPALAGFEWTPPEKAAPVPIPEPQPVPPPMDSDALPEIEDMQPLPPVSEPSQSQDEQAGKLHVIEMKRPQEDKPPLEEGAVMSAPISPDTSMQTPTPEPFPLTEGHQGEDAIMSKSSVEEPAPTPPAGVNINPYPLESGQATPPVEAAAMPQAEEIMWNRTEFEVVEGFGSDMPLALALQQVVPPRYAYSFGKGVNPGHLVSWEGGKPWNQVLNDMISPLKLRTQIEGNVIKILNAQTPAAVNLGEPVPNLEDQAAPEPPMEEQMEPLPPLEKQESEEQKQALVAPAENQEQKAEAPVMQAKAAEIAEKPEVTKISSSNRKVILDPGEAKPLESAHKSVEKRPAKDLTKLAKAPEAEASPPSEEALEKADIKPASAKADEQQLGQPRIWEAKRGSSLRETLDAWASQANVTLTWNAQEDFKLNSSIMFSGPFDNAVKVLFAQAVKNGPAHTFKPGPSAELIVGDLPPEEAVDSAG